MDSVTFSSFSTIVKNWTFFLDITQGDTLEPKAEKIIQEKKNNEVNSGSNVLKIDPDKENEDKNIETELPSTFRQQEDEEATSFKVIYNKNKYDVNFPLNQTVMQLKHHLQNIIGTLK